MNLSTNQTPSAAKRWANWGTNLLVSGIVIVTALVLGRQMREWWIQDTSSSEPGNALSVLGPSAVGSGDQTQSLEFGDLPFAFTRMELEGTVDEALAALRRHGREAAERSDRQVLDRIPGAAELRLVEQSAHMTPIDESPGRWRMFALRGPIPMVTAVSEIADFDTESDGENADVGGAGRRVLSWGVAIPHHDNGRTNWTLFTWGASNHLAGRLVDLPDLPLPAGSVRTMSVAGEEGSALVAFRGTGSLVTWKSSVDGWFRERGWTGGEWRSVADVWHARFTAADGGWIDVQVAATRDQQLRGILTLVSERGKRQ